MNRLFFYAVLLAQVGLMAQTGTANCNCCTENHKAFDFWVGEWIVSNADGTAAGQNKITKEENGCVLRENWISAKSGFTGTSLNFYNQQTMQWEQLWVDNAGNCLKLKGNRSGNQMVLSSDTFEHTDGEHYVNRITWTLNDDGSVNQLWELLQGEIVKQVVFDGLYKKTE